jgi:predicted nucleotidyltransferase
MSVAERFQRAMERLEPSKADIEKAKALHTEIRTSLIGRDDVEDTFLTGSYKRSTAVNPLHDVDIFAVFSYASAKLDAKVLLDRVASALTRTFPHAKVRRQSRSVGMEIPGTHITFDIVPAVRGGNDSFRIPDRKSGTWVATFPKHAMDAVVAANEKVHGRLHPLIKLAKRWNDVTAKELGIHEDGGLVKPFKSYHLEVLCYGFRPSEPYNPRAGFAELLAHLANHHADKVRPPGGGEPLGVYRGDHRVSLARVSEILSTAAKRALMAVEKEKHNPSHANTIWRELLSDIYE